MSTTVPDHPNYVGCLWRLLASDDPSVDAFICRDLDDPLDPRGLVMLQNRWLNRPASSFAGVQYQEERYDTPRRRSMVNLGWYGQRRLPGGSQPSVAAAIASFARDGQHDYYTADEEFVTDVWIPAPWAMMCECVHVHPPRSSPCDARATWATPPDCPATPTAARCRPPAAVPPPSSNLQWLLARAYRSFLRTQLPSVDLSGRDMVVRLG